MGKSWKGRVAQWAHALGPTTETAGEGFPAPRVCRAPHPSGHPSTLHSSLKVYKCGVVGVRGGEHAPRGTLLDSRRPGFRWKGVAAEERRPLFLLLLEEADLWKELG